MSPPIKLEKITKSNKKDLFELVSNINVMKYVGDRKTWKVLTCLEGRILVVLVNCDKKSKNFGRHFKIKLKANDFKSIVISPMVGNSYLCLDKKNIIYYKVLHNGKYNDFDKQFTYKWNDKKFGISWPIKKPILSKRDI